MHNDHNGYAQQCFNIPQAHLRVATTTLPEEESYNRQRNEGEQLSRETKACEELTAGEKSVIFPK